MKKIIIYTLLLTVSTLSASAQKDADARAILNQVSQKYHAYNVVKSDFTFTLIQTSTAETQTQNGTLIVQAKSNKFKLTLYSPDPAAKNTIEQEIISDGKSQWTYLQKDKEVQLNNLDKSDNSFNPAQMFTLYEKGYKYLFTGTENDKGHIYQVIDLTPEDINKEFFKVRLRIDKAKKQLYSALIFDKNGDRYNYVIRTFTPNIQVSDNTFIFDKKAHPGVEMVDLR